MKKTRLSLKHEVTINNEKLNFLKISKHVFKLI